MINQFGENINVDSLEQHTYDDQPGEIFYTCPRCGGEYLIDFMTEYQGRTVCIDCWSKLTNS